MYSSSLLVLCEDWDRLTNKETGYLSRGHCLMELCTSKLPRRDVHGRWYIPGFQAAGEWGFCIGLNISTNELRPLDWSDFLTAGSPLEGRFTNECDKVPMGPLLQSYVKIFDWFNTSYLDNLRRCRTWREVRDYVGVQDFPQMGGLEHEKSPRFETPKEFADYLLPPAYIANLAASVIAAGYDASPEKLSRSSKIGSPEVATDRTDETTVGTQRAPLPPRLANTPPDRKGTQRAPHPPPLVKTPPERVGAESDDTDDT